MSFSLRVRYSQGATLDGMGCLLALLFLPSVLYHVAHPPLGRTHTSSVIFSFTFSDYLNCTRTRFAAFVSFDFSALSYTEMYDSFTSFNSSLFCASVVVCQLDSITCKILSKRLVVIHDRHLKKPIDHELCCRYNDTLHIIYSRR